MKNSARIISLLLITCMMISSMAFAASYSDVTDDKAYYNAVSLLSSLDIIKGYEDGTFGPDRDVTRAEFTVMLMRTMGISNMGSNDLAGMPFTDLATVKDWAASDIRTAYDLGIINGMDATTFAPDEKVTYEQSLKMVVCALGYEPVALDKVGGNRDLIWPNGYLLAATQINITSGISVVTNQPAKRWEIARILYNALEVDLMEKVEIAGVERYQIKDDKTFLSDKLRVRYGTGEVVADEKTSVDSEGRIARAGEALIKQDDTLNTEPFIKGNVSTSGIVGRMVKYYYREDNNFVKTLVYLEDKTKNSSVITLDAEDIEDVTGTLSRGITIKYYKDPADRNTTDLTIKENPVVSINGRVAKTSEITADTFKPDSGSVELIDSDNNGTYDKVNIIAYETYVVNSVNTTDKNVVDTYRLANQNKLLSIDEDDIQKKVVIKRTDGTSLTLSSIKQWDVLSVKESDAAAGKNVMEVIVSSQFVSGNITQLDKGADELSISGKPYKFSKYFTTYGGPTYKDLTIDDGGKFYLDKDGKVAALDKSESGGGSYGYLLTTVPDRDVAKFRIFTPNGSLQTYSGASRVRIDGESISNANTIVNTIIETSKTSTINLDKGTNDKDELKGAQLVKYTLNGSGQVSAIDTVAPSKTEDLTVFEIDPVEDEDGDFSYEMTHNNREFKISNKSFRIDTNTQVFIVPSDRNKEEDYYYKKGTDATSHFSNNKSYFVEAYDITGNMKFAKAVVLYASDVNNKITAETPIAVVQAKANKNNPSGDASTELTAYIIGKDKSGAIETIFTESSTTLSDVETGDVIRYLTTSSGYIKDGSVKKIVDVSGDATESNYESEETYTNKQPLCTLKTGLLNAGDDKMFELYLEKNIADITDTSTRESFTADSSTLFFTYKATQSNKLEQLSTLNLGTLPAYELTESTAAEIFVYSYEGKVKAVYVIER